MMMMFILYMRTRNCHFSIFLLSILCSHLNFLFFFIFIFYFILLFDSLLNVKKIITLQQQLNYQKKKKCPHVIVKSNH